MATNCTEMAMEYNVSASYSNSSNSSPDQSTSTHSPELPLITGMFGLMVSNTPFPPSTPSLKYDEQTQQITRSVYDYPLITANLPAATAVNLTKPADSLVTTDSGDSVVSFERPIPPRHRNRHISPRHRRQGHAQAPRHAHALSAQNTQSVENGNGPRDEYFENLMKLPHLRKHRHVLSTSDVNKRPRDYNSYRVGVNSNKSLTVTESTSEDTDSTGSHSGERLMSGRRPRTRRRRVHERVRNGNAGDLNRNNNSWHCAGQHEKGALIKTELCENWVQRGHCTYGQRCHFAHGRADIRTRRNICNFKTQPCCDPARSDTKLCLFGKRCNYAHPGEPLRRPQEADYMDEEYTARIAMDYGPETPYPFGIYV